MTETPNQTDTTAELPAGPGVAFTFIYYFSGVSLITAVFVVKTLGVGFSSGLTGQLALTVGSIGGLLGVFYNRTRTLEIPASNPQALMKRLETILLEMGYTASETEGSLLVYQRSQFRRLFSGDIYVQRQKNSVVIVSRAANIRTLEKRLG